MGAGRVLAIVMLVTVASARVTVAAQEGSTADEAVSPSTPHAAITNQAPDRPGEAKIRKSYLVPALDILAFDFLLNRSNYYFIDKQVYGTSASTMKRNLKGRWVVDSDPFGVNQFYHPYQGSIYFGSARSAGLGYWSSLGYTFGGSLLWEIAGETSHPSINDQVTTGVGGTFLGEPLFRMASLLLEGRGGEPGLWRRLGAATISPPTGVNRVLFGGRFDDVFPSRHPPFFARARLGASLTNPLSLGGIKQTIQRREVAADFHGTYGLPGNPDYRHSRPFDYFDFQFTAANASVFENIMSRGLLLGTDYGTGNIHRGVWGLYGNYDYISPQVFRISSTAVSLGTTDEWRLSQAVTLLSTFLGGIGYGAAGTNHASNGARDYHYGATPEGLVAVRLLLGDVLNLDATVRGYHVSGIASTERRGSESIVRRDAALTVRAYGHQTLTLKYIASIRDARYPDGANQHQTVGTFSVLYGLISDTRFGAVGRRTKDASGD